MVTKSCSQLRHLFRHVTAFTAHSHVSTVQHTCCIRIPTGVSGCEMKAVPAHYTACCHVFTNLHRQLCNNISRPMSRIFLFRAVLPCLVTELAVQSTYLEHLGLYCSSLSPCDSVPAHFVVLLSGFTHKFILK